MWKREFMYQISVYNVKSKNGMVEELHSFIDSLDANQMYKDLSNDATRIVDQDQYDNLLAIYNRKALPSMISAVFDLKNYPTHVLRFIREGKGADIISAMKTRCPVLE